jgi:hypothetical protein
MNGRHVADQFAEFCRHGTLLPLQPQQKFSEADLVPIDLEPIQPHATLRLFGVVVRRRQAEGAVVCAAGSHEKRTFCDGDHR